MLKKLFIIFIMIVISPVTLAKSLGNDINTDEYPQGEQVLPEIKVNPNYVISGSIEKNIDMTLDNCLKLALGNNPQINAAFQDILASDARIKQVWSNFFPTISWQTGYTRLRQLQLSDALGQSLEFNYYLLGQISLQEMLYDFGVTQNQATIKSGQGFDDIMITQLMAANRRNIERLARGISDGCIDINPVNMY